MSQEAGKDLAASVRARLLNRAKAERSDFNGVLVRYALERLLYRLSQSTHSDRFLLKGAMLSAFASTRPASAQKKFARKRATRAPVSSSLGTWRAHA